MPKRPAGLFRGSTRREAEPQWIRKMVEEDMMPHTADGRVRQGQRAGRQWMGKASHQSGKGAGRDVLCGSQHAVDPTMPEGIERPIAAELAVVLL